MEFITNALTEIFNYFFQQNAPMTILVFIILIGLFAGIKFYSKNIVKPLVEKDKSYHLIEQQMNIVEDNIDKFHMLLYGLYRTARRKQLEERGVENARDTLEMDIHVFMHSLQLWGVLEEIRKEFRAFFRENHLASMNEQEFSLYKIKRQGQLWARMIRAINEYWYPMTEGPSRSDMFDIHEENKEKILNIAGEIFDQGRNTANEFVVKKHFFDLLKKRDR